MAVAWSLRSSHKPSTESFRPHKAAGERRTPVQQDRATHNINTQLHRTQEQNKERASEMERRKEKENNKRMCSGDASKRKRKCEEVRKEGCPPVSWTTGTAPYACAYLG